MTGAKPVGLRPNHSPHCCESAEFTAPLALAPPYLDAECFEDLGFHNLASEMPTPAMTAVAGNPMVAFLCSDRPVKPGAGDACDGDSLVRSDRRCRISGLKLRTRGCWNLHMQNAPPA